MNYDLRNDAIRIIQRSINEVLPDKAVERALREFCRPAGKLILVSIGKAAWQMAAAVLRAIPDLDRGVVITKYGHVKEKLPGIICYEAGHPIPDENGFRASQEVLDLVRPLGKEDTVLFLVSGGGSALFESPLIPGEELKDITNQLLERGADIREINTIRKRFSAVKGGRFAQAVAPASIYSIILSDIIGDPLDMIASGPAAPDHTTCEQAEAIAHKYSLTLSPEAGDLLSKETVKQVPNVRSVVTGSVRELCRAAANACKDLGYDPIILTDTMCCEAREAGSFLGSIAASHAQDGKDLAFIAGGETIVHLKGSGKGGRNQEIALAASENVRGLSNVAVFSVGSDGTDGPTDAAGGYADGDTWNELHEKGITVYDVLERNDAYTALQEVNGLIMTGPTGTNVNDAAVVLIRKDPGHYVCEV